MRAFSTLKTICFDVDGVLADFFTAALEHIRGKDYDRNAQVVPMHTSRNYSVYEYTTADALKKLWEDILTDESWWTRVPEIPRNPWSSIKRLCELYTVYFVTDRGSNAQCAAVQTAQWLSWQGGIRNPNVVLTGMKGDFARVVQADYFLDDKWQNAAYVHWATKGMKKRTVSCLLNRPYNTDAPVPDGVRRVRSVDDFCQLVITGSE